MTELTAQQVDDLWREVVSDPEHDCSVFGHWFESQKKERGSDDATVMKIFGDLEMRRRRTLVNLALRRHCRHD